MTAHDRLTETHGLRGVTVIRCPECDAGEPCQLVRESGAIARPENGDGAEGAPSPMLDDAADRATFYGTRPGMVHLRPETVRALCDAADEVERLREEVSLARRIIDLDMRLHAPSASTAGCGGGIGGQMFTPHCPDYCEHPKHDADKALREDLLRDFYRLARTPLPERDASRAAHAALVAGIETGLRESACAECDHDRCATYRSAASWVRDYAALDHHAPTTGATP